MPSLSFDDITGRVTFNQSGRRSTMSFNVIASSEHIGKWKEDVNVTLDIDPVKFNRIYLTGTDVVDTFMVTSKRDPPVCCILCSNQHQTDKKATISSKVCKRFDP